jgi:general secretion pathway protein H
MPTARPTPSLIAGATRRARLRAFTLIELLVVVTLVSVMMGAVIMGMGAVTNAKLKSSATLVSAAIRSAFTRASATAKPMRVVLDLDKNRLWLEEGSNQMLVQDKDLSLTGGADPATEAEKAAAEQTSRILKGPKAPKPTFKAIKQAGFEDDDGESGRALGTNIRFREVHIAHQAEPLNEGRAYLYVWPGGLTELAYIQVAKGTSPTDDDTMTLLVHPLTGKVKIVRGVKTIRIPQPGEDMSDREDSNF